MKKIFSQTRSTLTVDAVLDSVIESFMRAVSLTFELIKFRKTSDPFESVSRSLNFSSLLSIFRISRTLA